MTTLTVVTSGQSIMMSATKKCTFTLIRTTLVRLNRRSLLKAVLTS
jgi:hypothetical protein